jgi:hypothetical protein
MDQGFPPMVYLQNAIVGGHIPFYTNYYQNGVPFFLNLRHELAFPINLALLYLLPIVYAFNSIVYLKFIVGSLAFFAVTFKLFNRRLVSYISTVMFAINSIAVARLIDGIGTLYFTIPIFVLSVFLIIEKKQIGYIILAWGSYWNVTSGYPPGTILIAMYIGGYLIYALKININKESLVSRIIISIKFLIASVIPVIPFILETSKYLLGSVDLNYRQDKWNVALSFKSVIGAYFPWNFGERISGFAIISDVIYLGVLFNILILIAIINFFKSGRPSFIKYNYFYFIFLSLVLFSADFRFYVYRHIPFANITNASVQNIIYTFILCIISAYGLSILLEIKVKKSFYFTILLVTLIYTYFGLFYFNENGNNSLIRPLFFITCIVVAFYMINSLGILKKFTSVLLIILVSADLHLMFKDYLWTVPERLVYPDTKSINWIAANQENYTSLALGTNFLPDASSANNLRILGGRGWFNKDLLGIYTSIDPGLKDSHPTQKFFNSESINFNSEIINYLSIKYILSGPKSKQLGFDSTEKLDKDNFLKVYDGQDAVIYENINVQPRLTIKCKVQKIDKDRFYNLLQTNRLDINNVIYLPKSAELKYDYRNNESTSQQLDFENQRDGKYLASVNTRENCILSISNTHDRDFEVKINGAKSRAIEINYNFIGVEIPKGQSDIEIYYESLGTKLYIPISVIFLLINAVYFISQIRKRLHKFRVQKVIIKL